MEKQLYFHPYRRLLLQTISLLLLMLTACIHEDDNENCENGREILVRFKYDHNMKFADAFNNEVNKINLYVFDENDILVEKITEEGDALKNRDYAIRLDLEPGTYHLVAWGGLTDISFQKTEEFVARMSECGTMTVALLCDNQVSEQALDPLWHGEQETFVVSETGTTETTIPLIKDTNVLRIVLHQTDGLSVTDDDFTLELSDDNTLLRYNNDIIPNGTVTYRPYVSGYYTTVSRAESIATAVYYEIHDSRLVDYSEARLKVTRNSDNATIINIPLIDYLLLTEMEGHKQTMSEQEYLDRQDEYSLTFFLDRNLSWLQTEVIINGWTVRFNNGEFN